MYGRSEDSKHKKSWNLKSHHHHHPWVFPTFFRGPWEAIRTAWDVIFEGWEIPGKLLAKQQRFLLIYVNMFKLFSTRSIWKIIIYKYTHVSTYIHLV